MKCRGFEEKVEKDRKQKKVSEAALRIPFSLLGQLGKVDVLVARHGESKAALRLRAIGLKKVSMQKLEPSAESKQDAKGARWCSRIHQEEARSSRCKLAGLRKTEQ